MDYIFIGFAIALGFYFAPVVLLGLAWVAMIFVAIIQEIFKAIRGDSNGKF